MANLTITIDDETLQNGWEVAGLRVKSPFRGS